MAEHCCKVLMPSGNWITSLGDRPRLSRDLYHNSYKQPLKKSSSSNGSRKKSKEESKTTIRKVKTEIQHTMTSGMQPKPF